MKNEIRKINKIKRREMSKKQVEEKSRIAAEIFLESSLFKQAESIMLYKPLGNETDTWTIIHKAYALGKKVVFPVTDKESNIITPYYGEENSVFKEGAYSVLEPWGTNIAEKIDVILVPGIAFDKTGARIGFGKGCYDMFLKDNCSIKVGLCYDFQLYEKIPTNEYDIKMDYIVTEKGIIKCEK